MMKRRSSGGAALALFAARAALFVGSVTACERAQGPASSSEPQVATDRELAPGQRPAPSAAGSAGAAATAAPPVPAPVPASSAQPSAAARVEKTAGVVERKREGEPAVLHAVRAAKNEGHDRVVFEFRERLPGYHFEYIDKPVRDCGAGDVKPIEGDGWLEARFYPAYAHTEEGQPTVAERELKPALPIVREIERTCDFEAVVTWVIGTSSPNRYAVLELSDPPRIVVDIDH